MKEFIIEGYEIRESSMTSDSDKQIYIVSTKAVAEDLVGGSPWLRYYPISQTIRVFDSVEEIKAAEEQALRESAWAKLSSAEKSALGWVSPTQKIPQP